MASGKRRRDPGQSEPIEALGQDPHASASVERVADLELAIGREVRSQRMARELTVAALADLAGLSVGMLSKIENGLTSPSLTTLKALAHAMSLPLTTFFRRFEEHRPAVHTKAGDAVEVSRRGTRANHQYRLLGHIGTNGSGVTVEPYLITLTEASDRFPTFQHEGIETIHMLEGIIGYRHGGHLYRLEPGDTLHFDADAPHGPAELVQLPARYLSIIAYSQTE